MSDNPFPSIDIHRAQQTLADLHEQVVNGNTRIELRGADNDGSAVIISKVELESLENALAILSNTPDVRAVCKVLQRIASLTSDQPVPTFQMPEQVSCNS